MSSPTCRPAATTRRSVRSTRRGSPCPAMAAPRGAPTWHRGGTRCRCTPTPFATSAILLDPNPFHGDGSTGGGSCTFGILCSAVPGSNRGRADVFEVHVEPAGGANGTWTKDLGGRTIYF